MSEFSTDHIYFPKIHHIMFYVYGFLFIFAYILIIEWWLSSWKCLLHFIDVSEAMES